MAFDPRLLSYLMQSSGAMGQEEGPLIPPAPPGYPPNTQPLPMDMPQAAAPASQDIQGTEEISAKGLDPIEHKGLFGVKGTLRDILGVLGDTYLIANGRDGTYGDTRRRERAGADMAGRYQDNEEENFINNPLLAIQRLAEGGNIKEAQSLYEDYTKTQQAAATNKLAEARLSRQEARDDQLAKQGDIKAQKDLQDIAARTYGGIQNEETLAQFNERFGPILEKNGLGAIPLPRNLKEARNWGIDTYRSNVLEDKDQDRSQRGEIADQRVGATIRGQDIRSADTQRGQDIRSEDTRRGQDMRGKPRKPSSPMGSLPSMIPPAPRRKNDRITGPGGIRMISPDGKRWEIAKD